MPFFSIVWNFKTNQSCGSFRTKYLFEKNISFCFFNLHSFKFLMWNDHLLFFIQLFFFFVPAIVMWTLRMLVCPKVFHYRQCGTYRELFLKHCDFLLSLFLFISMYNLSVELEALRRWTYIYILYLFHLQNSVTQPGNKMILSLFID